MIPPGEKIVETKTCPVRGVEFHITDKDLAYYDSISPVINGKKYAIPSPTLCPAARQQRQMVWSNEQYLYKRTCEVTSRTVVSEFGPDNPRPVWHFREWLSDKFDPLAYGRDVDLSRSIMKQFYELEKEIPHPNVATDLNNENSDFCHQAGHMKNCYLMFHTSFAEDCYHGYGVKEAKSCVDCFYCHKSEFCYECVDVKECSNLAYCQTCQNCRESQFLHDCIGCDHCFLCHGLRNKQYCIMNEQLTPDQYKKRLDQLDVQAAAQADDIRAKLEAFKKKFPQRESKNIMHENVHGNYLYQAKDAFFCYDCSDIEACRYCTQLQLGSKYCYDMYQFGINIDHCYEQTQSGYNLSNCHFGYELIESCSELYYCMNSYTSRNCFACYGLNKNQFCILNKQYEEQEYYDLLEACIQKMQVDGEWGEFFDPREAHIPYNDSTAHVWYPLTEQDAKDRGYSWQDESRRNLDFKGEFYSPLAIDEYDERVVGEEEARQNIDACLEGVFQCQESGRPYKIIAQELGFYIDSNIPLPTRHPDVRRKRRFDMRDKRQMHARKCDKCGVDIPSVYAPEREERVYCESCYRKEVY